MLLLLSDKFVSLTQDITGDSEVVFECLDLGRELDKRVFSEGKLSNFLWGQENLSDFSFIMGDLLGVFEILSPEFWYKGRLVSFKDKDSEFLFSWSFS